MTVAKNGVVIDSNKLSPWCVGSPEQALTNGLNSYNHGSL